VGGNARNAGSKAVAIPIRIMKQVTSMACPLPPRGGRLSDRLHMRGSAQSVRQGLGSILSKVRDRSDRNQRGLRKAKHHLRGALSRTHRKIVARIHQRFAFGF
jgi:hypothetical protein